MDKVIEENFIPADLIESLKGLEGIIDPLQIQKDLNVHLKKIHVPEICDPKEEFIETGKFDRTCLPTEIPEKKRKELVGKIIKDINKDFAADNLALNIDPETSLTLAPECSDEFKEKIMQIALEEANSMAVEFPKLAARIPNSLINLCYSIVAFDFYVYALLYYYNKFDAGNISKIQLIIKNNKTKIDEFSSDNPVCLKLISLIKNRFDLYENQLIFANPVIDNTNESGFISSINGIFQSYVGSLSNNAFCVNNSRMLYQIQQDNRDLSIGIIYDYLKSINFDQLPDSQKKSPNIMDILNQKYSESIDAVISVINQRLTETFQNSEIASIFVYRDNSRQSITDELNKNFDIIVSSLTDIIKYYDSSNPNISGQKMLDKMKLITCCGKILVPQDAKIADALSTQNNDGQTEDRHTFSKKENPIVLQLKYWQVYAGYLSLVGLLPNYWAKGIIIPTPGGPQYLPCPIIWTPLFVINTPVNIMVMFLTINGMLPFPVLWELRFQPLADTESFLDTSMRGANLSIRSKTGNTVIGYPIVADIDTNPELSKKLPYSQDDLPVYEMLNPALNPSWLIYLNQWLSTICPKMGFIP